jgi:murein L,D-transpeptidase YafK
MPLTLLVGTAALTLVGSVDSVRASATTSPPARTTVVSSLASDERLSAFDARVPVDSILVEKSAHKLSLFQRGRVTRTYLVALGQQPVGDKVRRGDMRTPEGRFTIEARNPQSKFHRALRISYPDAAHRERARRLGVSPGGDIMIHGLPPKQAWVGPAHRDFDWTEGCIALTNAEIEELWSTVPVGTPIHILP